MIIKGRIIAHKVFGVANVIINPIMEYKATMNLKAFNVFSNLACNLKYLV